MKLTIEGTRPELFRFLHAKPVAVTATGYPPGVDADGVLRDPQAYFWWLIARAPGQPASDWVKVLTDSGLPEGFAPWVVPYDNGFYGLTQQIGADGVRGRLFLPTAAPDANGYYSHPIDLLANSGGDCSQAPQFCKWQWYDRGEGAPYDPIGAATGGGSGGGGGTTPPPSGGGLTEADVQRLIDDQCVKYDGSIALVSSGDAAAGIPQSLLTAERGGPTGFNKPFDLTSRDGASQPGPWESWRVKRGQ